MKKYFIILICFICLFSISCGTKLKDSTPSDGKLVNELTLKEKQKDIKLLKEVIKDKHVNYGHSVSADKLDEAIESLSKKLDTISSDDFAFEMMKIVALVGDNATTSTLDSTRYANRYYLPFELQKFEEGYIIYKAAEDYSQYIGWKIKAIENTDIDDAVEILKDYFGADTVARQKYLAIKNIVFWDLLKSAQIVSSKDVKIRLEYNGSEEVVTFSAYKNSDYSKMNFIKKAPSLISEYNGKYYSFDTKDNYIYIQFNVCNDDPDKSVSEFSEEIELIAKPNIFKSIILDLRNNPGGLQETIMPLVGVLLQYKANGGNVYVLVDEGTYGVAVVNSVATLGNIFTTIGSPTGGLSSYYGYKGYYTLPNSLLKISYPQQYFSYYSGDEIIAFSPSINKLQSYEDYANGEDSLIKTALLLSENN